MTSLTSSEQNKMADINCCTSRYLANKTGMPTELANKIVDLRKTTGRIQEFSDLWSIDEMNRRTMHELTKHFVIEQSRIPDTTDTSNNAAKRQTPRKRKRSSKKQSERKDTKLLERIPLLNMSLDSFTGSDRVTIFTPRVLETSPSGEKILAVYEVTPSKKLASDETKASTKISTRNNAPSTSRFSVNSRQTLSPTKEKSIRNWLKTSNAYNQGNKISKSSSKKRSRSKKRSVSSVKNDTQIDTNVINPAPLDDCAAGSGKVQTQRRRVTISNTASPLRITAYRQQTEQTCCSDYSDYTDTNYTPAQGRPRRDKVILRRRRSVSANSREVLINNKSPNISTDAHFSKNGRSTGTKRSGERQYMDSFPREQANTSGFSDEINPCRRHSRSPDSKNRGYEDRQSPDKHGHSIHYRHHQGKSKGHHRSRHEGQSNAVSECTII